MTCRRCSECVGEEHHLLGPTFIHGEDGDEAGFECKHCDYTCPAENCAECEELVPWPHLQRAHGNGDLFCPNCLARAERLSEP